MRRKQIISGLNNSQKFRFIISTGTGEEFGMILTITQMSEQIITTNARASVWSALAALAAARKTAVEKCEPIPSGLVVGAQGFHQIQVDLY